MSTADEARRPASGVLAELTNTLASARAAAERFLDLASLEARRAGLALVWMIALGLAAAVCAVTAWLGLMAALAVWAVSLGYPPLVAVFVLAALNLAGGVALVYRCVGMSRDLLFPATRRQIAGNRPAPPAGS
jgi:uncharacterized membrane protein YqjE